MGPSRINQELYSYTMLGVDITKYFAKFILNIVPYEKSQAMENFKKFLNKQGEALTFGVENTNYYYKTLAIGISIEVFQPEGRYIFVPKIKQYCVKFDKNNSKFSSSCASYQWTAIHFNYLYSCNVLDSETLEDPEVRKKFEKFIDMQNKAQIESSSTFFNDNFEVV